MTGRYPWGIGYYDMKGPEMVPLSFVMLPKLLHDMGFATHALGKWVSAARGLSGQQT